MTGRKATLGRGVEEVYEGGDEGVQLFGAARGEPQGHGGKGRDEQREADAARGRAEVGEEDAIAEALEKAREGDAGRGGGRAWPRGGEARAQAERTTARAARPRRGARSREGGAQRGEGPFSPRAHRSPPKPVVRFKRALTSEQREKYSALSRY